jgi:hypothetical protein
VHNEHYKLSSLCSSHSVLSQFKPIPSSLLFANYVYILLSVTIRATTTTVAMSQPQSTAPDAGTMESSERVLDYQFICSYLHRFGYICQPTEVALDELTAALTQYQANLGLPKTGAYDQDTSKSMALPRCGVKDFIRPFDFTMPRQKWGWTDLTYFYVSFYEQMSQEDVRRAVRAAFDKWEDCTPLTFREVFKTEEANFRIGFYRGDHGDQYAFNGIFGALYDRVLAHAFSPSDGRIHFNDLERWYVNFLETVATHEIGHALGLEHSPNREDVMYPTSNGQMNLQHHDIADIQSLYGPRVKGWFRSSRTKPSMFANKSDITATSRIANSVEVWWVGLNGTVQHAWYYDNDGWKTAEFAPPDSAAFAGIASLARIPGSMEVWWVGKRGSLEGSFWYEGGNWERYQIAGAGTVLNTSKIAAVSRHPTTMELFWVGPNDALYHAYWYEGAPWKYESLSVPGLAAPSTGIKALSRDLTHMELFWIGFNGSVMHAWWADGQGWHFGELAPPGSASTSSSVAGVSRLKDAMEVWWVGPDGSVQGCYWFEASGWFRYQLASAGSAVAAVGNVADPLTCGIEAIAPSGKSLNVWWTSPSRAVQYGYWTDTSGWQTKVLTKPGAVANGTDFACVSRNPNLTEVWYSNSNHALEELAWRG